MPSIDADGRSIHYETAGSGETVAFVGAAGLGPWQWGHQFEGVAGPREALIWDLPGTGRSEAPSGALDVDSLAADLESVLGAAEVHRAHLVGAGLGGMIALRYARDFGRARSLALFGTAASGDEVHESALRAMHPDSAERDLHRASLAGAFSDAFRHQEDIVARIVDWRQAEDATGDALGWQLDAMLGFEAGPLYAVDRPAIVVHGVDDPVVPAAAGEALAEGLPRGEFVPVVGRHLAHVEQGPAVTDNLVAWLDDDGRVGADDRTGSR